MWGKADKFVVGDIILTGTVRSSFHVGRHFDDAAVDDGYDSSASIRPLTRAFICEVCV